VEQVGVEQSRGGGTDEQQQGGKLLLRKSNFAAKDFKAGQSIHAGGPENEFKFE
jgi:hypothetical protein